ncbi:hypothetical protein B0H10DRAFT_33049 [Mycena sp. CBHHK59/15]|nr:hypothetical protein B0H10DRAFT_33049 [Mycena sp. CBHHK59/15]
MEGRGLLIRPGSQPKSRRQVTSNPCSNHSLFSVGVCGSVYSLEMTDKATKLKRKHEDAESTTKTSKVGGKLKREKRKLEETGDMLGADNQEETREPKKKKQKKNKTGFPDPQDDPLLSEQASKALSYAFSQFRKPKTWKFNKARQNWLIRNLWSNETVPDTYLALVVQYLSNVKGGVRETLIKESQSALSISSAMPDGSSPADGASEAVLVNIDRIEIEKDKTKHARARALLDALITDGSTSIS